MAQVTIEVGRAKNGDLTVKPNWAKVKRGDSVTWVIKSSGVKKITRISRKRTSINVFGTHPAPVGGNYKKWNGKIKKVFKKLPANEYYNIWWLPSEGGAPRKHDPRIQVH